MKTEAEIYKACIDSGVKLGDIVRLSSGEIRMVTFLNGSGISLSGEVSYVLPLSANCTRWPTHFARPVYKAGAFSYESKILDDYRGLGVFTQVGDTYFHSTWEIKYPEPEPLTLEQRIERLEAELREARRYGVGSDAGHYVLSTEKIKVEK